MKTNNNIIIVLIIVLSVGLSSCSRRISRNIAENKESIKKKNNNTKAENKTKQEKAEKEEKKVKDPILLAEKNTTSAGRKILETGREMALVEKVIYKGSCWNYINEVFKRAGYGSSKKIVYKQKQSGPYVDVSKIQPGDWIYYVNYSYGQVGHSGIFVYWEDYENKIGVTLSYGGEKRNEPGRYRAYDLKSVYYITRAYDKE